MGKHNPTGGLTTGFTGGVFTQAENQVIIIGGGIDKRRRLLNRRSWHEVKP